MFLMNRTILTSLLSGGVFLALSCPSMLHAEAAALSEADRIALIEQLELIEKESDERVDGLYRRAIQDYRSAIRSDDATMDLYLKCYEKVRYDDEQRKTQEFREWKRRNKDEINSPSMRMALRHQLSWLLLSIEAAKRDGDLTEMGQRATTHLDQIFKNAETLKNHRGILSKNVLSSVFAQAYKLNIKVKDWPKSALDIAQIYDKVVMPPLRIPSKVSGLRSAWARRIQHEGFIYEKLSQRESRRGGGKGATLPLEVENFLSKIRPQLLWDMEVDCFNAGDERASALRMLKHLENYITHKDAPQWIKAFQTMVSPTDNTEKSPDT